MAHRQFTGLRITLLAALGVTAAWGCGDDDGNGADQLAGAAGKKPQGGGGGTRGGAGGAQGGIFFGGAGQNPGGRGGAGGTDVPIGGGGTDGGGFGGAGMGGGGFGGGGQAGLGGAGAGGQLFGFLTCRNPRPVANGYVRCRGDWLHRPERAACPIWLDETAGGAGGVGGTGAAGDSGAAGEGTCYRDSDCTAHPYGVCIIAPVQGSPAGANYCDYGCSTDDECGPTEICVCGAKIGMCAPATCQSDADCGEFLCAAPASIDPCFGTSSYQFSCQTPDDECQSASDCPQGGATSDGPVECATNSTRVCQVGPVCGRPFLVGGETREASVRANDEWAASAAPSSSELDLRTRRALEEHWTRMALMEHASVAAFARFTLELLSLGAPADFLLATQRALGDEIAHAQACFGLASAYAGHAVGPGPMSLDGALPAGQSARDIIRCAFLEACIGETIAAAEALAALDRAEDEAVRRVLARIASDESRHAELGWRFLQWALERADERERLSLEAELECLLEAELSKRTDCEATAGDDPAVRAHGLLPASVQASVRDAALCDVVLPCARALGIFCEARAA